MKAAIFHGPNQPLTIEQVDIDEPREREVVVRTVASGVCHSDLHFVDGLYMWPTPAVLGHEAAGVVEKVGSQVSLSEARRSRDRMPLGLLRLLRGLHVGPSEPLLEQGRDAARRQRQAAPLAGGQDGQSVRRPLGLRREDAPARERTGEDRRRHAARSRGADRMRRHDRRRRGAQHREGRAGLDGRRVRRRRRRSRDHPGRAHRGRADDHRGRQIPDQARNREEARRDSRRRRVQGRRGRRRSAR